jgi:RNA polymerase sigma factor (sigma-70 family)
MLTTIQSESEGHAGPEIVNLAGWLRTVAGRRIIDHFRAAARVQHLLQLPPNNRPDPDVADPAKQHELKETRVEVRQVMDSMPEQYRLALEWKYLEKLSVREIADRWGMTEKAAESILFRARREFRDRLAKQQHNEPSHNESSRNESSRNESSHNESSRNEPSHNESSRNGQRSRPPDAIPDEAAEHSATHKSL